jgi:hypothetical protein
VKYSMQYEEDNRPKELHSGLLSNKERERLPGSIEVSKSFGYKMKSRVRKKVQVSFDQNPATGSSFFTK